MEFVGVCLLERLLSILFSFFSYIFSPIFSYYFLLLRGTLQSIQYAIPSFPIA